MMCCNCIPWENPNYVMVHKYFYFFCKDNNFYGFMTMSYVICIKYPVISKKGSRQIFFIWNRCEQPTNSLSFRVSIEAFLHESFLQHSYHNLVLCLNIISIWSAETHGCWKQSSTLWEVKIQDVSGKTRSCCLNFYVGTK